MKFLCRSIPSNEIPSHYIRSHYTPSHDIPCNIVPCNDHLSPVLPPLSPSLLSYPLYPPPPPSFCVLVGLGMGGRQDPVLLHAQLAETVCSFLTAATTTTTTTTPTSATAKALAVTSDDTSMVRFEDPAVEAAKLTARQFSSFHEITTTAATTCDISKTTTTMSTTTTTSNIETKAVSV